MIDIYLGERKMLNFFSSNVLKSLLGCCLMIICSSVGVRAMSSYATCNAHSTCYSSGEFCDNSNDCMACASYDQSDSIDNQKPAWCNDYDAYGLGEVYISNSYTLRNTQKRAYDPSSPQAGTHCPTLDACASQCTETYQVTKTDAVITLTSTHANTDSCTCETLVFSKVYGADEEWWWTSTNANFGTATTRIEIDQFSPDMLDLALTNNDNSIDCLYEYDIEYEMSLTDSSVLKYESQTVQDGVEAYCPTFGACVLNCRSEYTVTTSGTNVITLTSTFSDTAECVCDKITFTMVNGYFRSTNVFGLTIPEGGRGDSEILQFSPDALKLYVFTEDSAATTVTDCVWKYSINDAPAPTPTPTPSSSSTCKLNVLVGVLFAILVATLLA